ncbi:zeta toxin family protein [Streptomyces sp. NPDC002742]|uniref:zeta toxin family protein n=1 Tax=Streptomyces sp. NPDC002742 TaxID=3364663 RepID=UPI0036A9BAA4
MLSEQEHARILADLILPVWVHGAASQQAPVVFFVAGAPGSGKSFLADVLQESLNRRGGTVRVAGDLYKTVHPSYAELLAEDERTAGLKVRPDVRLWQSEVEEHVRLCAADAVIETALGDVDEFRTAARAFRMAGYRIEIAVLSTSEALSQLGVLDRYVRQVYDRSTGRYVSWENHDTCVRGLLATLKVVEDECLADRITVFRRDLEVLYRNELASGRWRRPAAAVRAIRSEWARPWSAQRSWRFRQELSEIQRKLSDLRVSSGQRLMVSGGLERAFALSEAVRRIAQPLIDPPGVDYHRLSAAEHRWIFRTVIVPELGAITRHDKPVVVYVVGQPGAGKSELARTIRRSMRHRRPTAIVGDNFKAAHPDYLRLLEENPRTASAKIRADYSAWQTESEAYVRERGGDVVIEIAPGNAQQFLASATRFHRAGYRVEVVALGVRAADSKQATMTRYEEAARKGLPARFTSASGHDVCFRAVADTVLAAEQSPWVDSLVIMRRDAAALYRNSRAADGQWVHLPVAALALTGEQQRPYTEAEAARFRAVQRKLTTALPRYRAEIAQITQLAWPLMPEHLHQPRLAGPGVPGLLPARYLAEPDTTAGTGAAE